MSAKEYRDKNLHEGKWIESDEEFKRFLDAMNHRTLEDVKELMEKRIKELDQMVHNGMLAEQKQDNAQGARAELKYQLSELEKLKL